jgi:hypothetical protein
MADDDLPDFPKGQFSMTPGGQLRQVTQVNMRLANGAKLKHSLAVSPSGFVKGTKDLGGSFTMEVPRKGLERDILENIDKATPQQGRLEIPGTAIVAKIVLTNADITASTEDAVQFRVDYIGKRQSVIKQAT